MSDSIAALSRGEDIEPIDGRALLPRVAALAGDPER